MAAAEAPNLVGKTGKDIALLVKSGEITEKDAEKFVVDRAKRKFKSQLEAAA